MNFHKGIILTLVSLFSIVLIGCGGNETINNSDNTETDNIASPSVASEEVVSPLSVADNGFVATPIPTVEINIEPSAGIFKIDFYSIGMLEGKKMQISLIANGLIPEGDYQAIISGDGVFETYQCMKHGSLNNLLSCWGKIIPEEKIVSIQIVKPSVLADDFDFSDAQLVSDQLSGGEKVADPWKAWEMVDKCQNAKNKGDSVAGCDTITLEKYLPQTECYGVISCANTCTQELNTSDEIQKIFDVAIKVSTLDSPPSSCQDFVKLLQPDNSIPVGLPTGMETYFWSSIINTNFTVVETKDLNSVVVDNGSGMLPNPLVNNNLQAAASVLFGNKAQEEIALLVGEDSPLDIFSVWIGGELAISGNSFQSLNVNEAIPKTNPVFNILAMIEEEAPEMNPLLLQMYADANTEIVTGIEAPEPVPDLGNLTDAMIDELFECAADNNYDTDLGSETEILDFINKLILRKLRGDINACETDNIEFLKSYFMMLMFDTSACMGNMYQYATWNDSFLLYPEMWGNIDDLEGWATGEESYGGEEITDDESKAMSACSSESVLEMMAIYEEIFMTQFPSELATCMQSFDPKFKWHEFFDEGLNNFYLYLESLKTEGSDDLDPSCNSPEVDDYFDAFLLANSHKAWVMDEYIPSKVQDCAKDLGYEFSIWYGRDSWEESLYSFYYQELTDWGVEHDYTWNLFPASCKTDEFFDWLEMMEYGDPNQTAPDDTFCETCSTTYDCTIEPNLFYCQEEIPEDDGYLTLAQQCITDISWPDNSATYYQAANLVAYLTAAAPWMTQDSMPQTCEATLLSVASNHNRPFSIFTSQVLNRWGDDGTFVWGKDEPTTGVLGTLDGYKIPDMSLFIIVPTETPRPANDGGGSSTPDCPPGLWWFPDLGACWSN